MNNFIKEIVIGAMVIVSVIIAYGVLFITGSWLGALIIVAAPLLFLLPSALKNRQINKHEIIKGFSLFCSILVALGLLSYLFMWYALK